ncbi:MAG: biopolymer transporter ExbD [Chthoniobacteraceae bacterium]
MRRFSDRHALQTLSELNVTPLLDLAFVLLIIFMITTPLMENSTDLVLPSGEAKQATNLEGVRTVSIHKDETITLNDQFMTTDALSTALAAQLETQPDLGVLIRPHKELPVQRFSEVLDAVKRAGVKRIGFVQTTKE